MTAGRPNLIDELILQKLEEAFSMGCTDLEACVLANISKSTLYNYQNDHPEFVERKDELKEKPILQARTTVINSLKGDLASAWRYLERKDKTLNPKNELDITSKGEKLSINDEQLTQLIRARTERADSN